MRNFVLYDEAGNELMDLGNLEPWCHSVGMMPITRIEYKRNSLIITWATTEELEEMKRSNATFDDDF